MQVNHLPDAWQKRWQQQQFSQPTKIQEEAFNRMIQGESFVGVSPTGSGKTLAYLLPAMLQIKEKQLTQVLILTATQELAMQVTEVARAWANDLDLKVQPLIGGANIKRQIEKLKEKPEVIIGTVGRVVELVQQRKLKLHLIKTLILDEADQLLASKEASLLGHVMKAVDKNVQLTAFSASGQNLPTLFAKYYQKNLSLVDVTDQDDSQGRIFHGYIIWPKRQSVDALRRIAHIPSMQALVFFNQLSDLGAAEDKLLYHQLAVSSLASDQNKLMRKLALTAFKEGKSTLLLSTDIAARGLDIVELPYVINVDIPQDKASYLHRAGRVGRMGHDGMVLTLLEAHQVREYKKLLQDLDLTAEEYYLYAGQVTKEKPQKESGAKTPKIKKKDKNKKIRKK
ncbi:DEAD/DEAH box helicase [Enterococcus columbae]|uniref:DEAD/DEAH box helicase n=1 Tax=Enterococcus columbae DSM 7374 = ATCC 51263 TaxID=1121865 RepID=S1NW44_9ENTE|nr:DEAD/DEAH box helicase [Enterococcus columbae]EOT44193.1 hypothetical protein OMW_00247 [Enterococcus columbae DSM 7374 = ATCC 51263]EOW84351.1 hypothetical protein I568_00845 [Enterococcus columbae DSM 7374 = ATCC 51263]OJG26091.1 hypothetical protein RR47_GL000889 [Enterococcus columbae DSM 7374 = ATCC 51263]